MLKQVYFEAKFSISLQQKVGTNISIDIPSIIETRSQLNYLTLVHTSLAISLYLEKPRDQYTSSQDIGLGHQDVTEGSTTRSTIVYIACIFV